MNNFKHKGLVLLVTLLTVSTLTADNSGKTYFGLGAGYSSFNAKFVDGSHYMNDENYAYSRDSNSRSSDNMGVKFYGGYQFNKIIAVEASFTDFGTQDTGNYTQNPQSVSVYANAGYGFSDNQLRPFTLLGLTYIQTNQSRNLLDDELGAVHVGLGIEYYPKKLKGFGFRAAWESDINMQMRGASNASGTYYETEMFFQRYGLFYVGAQYRF